MSFVNVTSGLLLAGANYPASRTGNSISATATTMGTASDAANLHRRFDVIVFLPLPRVSSQRFRACEEIGVVQAFRPAVSGGPEGPHYIGSDFFTGPHLKISSILGYR